MIFTANRLIGARKTCIPNPSSGWQYQQNLNSTNLQHKKTQTTATNNY